MGKAVIINGNPSQVSRLNGMIQYVEQRLLQAGIEIEHIRVAELPAEDLIKAKFDSEAILHANKKVEEAEAIVIASPVYKAAYTGVLKTYLDLLPQKGLAGKIVLPLFIGGTIAHLLSIDYALKPVLSALGSRHILGGVYAVDTWIIRNEQEGYHLSEDLIHRLDEAVTEFAEEIKRRTELLLERVE
ncbi:NADPH-dependent FMN reductase [Parageobacillus thermoglucosidasius]|uniref:NADPH-dependent FMN reductase n=1 Tax=Parageobacillus thermoglucosidasius TaxID=1426 RepID=UPI00025B7324|nr:NADPH-dependent FMN reductase [Parageobacillus thermoglucosidasius]KYD14684.1 FMN reductase [Anoxybacillus flavithermus]REK55140.1 MAG: FMN reductase (NADPH) [Geobacillus sp.]EID43841.1 FMN reductase [Parageobacillus thermoglucosidasius TNO-09.020]OAO85548.1 FMN reductase [Parageobacillus thermoglucosidasius]OUM92930.1 MAG: FMN reductase (NADPH) [Parageobacillus thermoglucosidasius]